jgi:hypothetical protein
MAPFLFFAIFYLLTAARNAVSRRVGGLDGVALYVLNQATRFLFCLIASAWMGRLEGMSNRRLWPAVAPVVPPVFLAGNADRLRALSASSP